MGFQKENFVGNPNKQEFIDGDEELEYLSGDEIDFNPFGLPAGDPDLILDGNYDIVDMVDDDDDYDPEDDYEDFLSDTDYEYDEADGSEASGSEPVNFSDADQEELPAADETNQDTSNKASGDNKTVETKINGEVKTSGAGDVSSNEADGDT